MVLQLRANECICRLRGIHLESIIWRLSNGWRPTRPSKNSTIERNFSREESNVSGAPGEANQPGVQRPHAGHNLLQVEEARPVCGWQRAVDSGVENDLDLRVLSAFAGPFDYAQGNLSTALGFASLR